MTIAELHIGIDVGLRGTNTFTHRSLDPEEKDWWLNKAQYEYIWNKTDSVINPKQQEFAVTKKRLGDIQNLIIPKTVKLYKESDGVFFGILPSDFLLYIDDKSSLLKCGKSKNYDIEKDIKNYFVVPFKNITNFNLSINLKNNSNVVTEIFNSNSNIEFANAYTESEASFYYKYWIMNDSNLPENVEIYWENYNGIFKSESFIIVTDNSFKEVNLQKENIVTVISKNTIEFNYYNITQDDKTFISGTLLSPENLSKVQDNYFYKPRKDKVFYTLKNNKIYVYCDKNLIMNEIQFDYYREPRYINYILGITSEITQTRHHELLDIAIKQICTLNPNENYQTLIPNIIQNQN